MSKSLVYFILSAILSIVTLYTKSEHSFDYVLVVPVGLYFIAAVLLAWKPEVETRNKIAFSAPALLLWLVLFSVSYNLLFFIIAPIAGGVGAWVIVLLCNKYLDIYFNPIKFIIIAGVVGSIIGVLLMMVMKGLPKDTFTMGLKSGLIVAFWQIGVGWQMLKSIRKEVEEEEL